MKFARFRHEDKEQLGVVREGKLYAQAAASKAGPFGELAELLAKGGEALQQAGAQCLKGGVVDVLGIQYLPPFRSQRKWSALA